MSLAELLGPLDDLLQRSGVRYAIIGAYAVAAWGTIRATRDLDLLVETGDLDLVRNALHLAGFNFEYRLGDPDDPIHCVLRLQLPTESGPQEIDILAGIKNAPADITRRATLLSLGTRTLPVAVPEDVIVLKLLAGSIQDIEDVRAILSIQRDSISRSLLEKLCPPHLKIRLEALLGEFPQKQA